MRKPSSERIDHSMRVKFNPLALLLDSSLEGEFDLVQRIIYEVRPFFIIRNICYSFYCYFIYYFWVMACDCKIRLLFLLRSDLLQIFAHFDFSLNYK